MLSIFIRASCCLPQYRSHILDTMPADMDIKNMSSPFTASLNGNTYKCYNKTTEVARLTTDPKEYILKRLANTSYTFTHTRYWFFDFIIGSKLIQYRYDDDGKKIDEFVLGQETGQDYFVISSGVATQFSMGTTCVVTGKPRETRVEFICDLSSSGDGSVSSISESYFCNYLVRFNTQHACPFVNLTSREVTDVYCIKDHSDL